MTAEEKSALVERLATAEKFENFALPLLDGTAIGDEFLRSTGFEVSIMNSEATQDFGETRIILWQDGTCFIHQGPDQSATVPKSIKTRGELRLLCLSLGITLQEPATESIQQQRTTT